MPKLSELLKDETFQKAMLFGAAEQLMEERYYDKPYDQLELHQRARCKVEAARAFEIVKKTLRNFKRLKEK